MRRLWPAIGVCALTLACGRPNPGFKLIDSGDVSDSEGQSASVGSTDSGPLTGSPTTSTSDATGGMTGSEGSMSSAVSGSTGDTGATTMAPGHWEFPSDCPDPNLQTEVTLPAVADTFFLNEIEVSQCSWLAEMGIEGPDCLNLQFSQASEFQLYLTSGGNLDPLDDSVSIYAARFQPPTFQGLQIPEQAFLAVKVKVHLFQPLVNPWIGMLAVRRFTDGDLWSADEGLEFTPCFKPAASYRCRVCTAAEMVQEACAADWGNLHPGVPYDPKEPVAKTLNVADPPGVDGVDVPIEFGPADVAWLTDEGMMLMPAAEVARNVIGVKTSESPNAPQLYVRYCTPEWVLDT
jgi:hypothetical protein